MIMKLQFWLDTEFVLLMKIFPRRKNIEFITKITDLPESLFDTGNEAIFLFKTI